MLLIKFLFLLTFISFSFANTKDPKDLRIYPQKASFYASNLTVLSTKKKKKLYKEFIYSYFKAWKFKKSPLSVKSATWGMAYKNSKVYAENRRLINKKWFDDINKLSNMENFDEKKLKAITVRNSHLRLFPSSRPIFKSFDKAGEGYPFDYGQNSSVNINLPLYLSHYSKDRAWAFVSASFASGWIMVKDIAIIDDELIKKFRGENSYFVAIKDDFPIYKNKIFRDYVKLGTIFPSRKGKFAMVIRDNTGKGYISRIDSNKNIVKFPIRFNQKNINNIINELINKPYGWGGMLGNRDCSLLTKDLLAPFAFPIKRHSSAQLRNGKYISLENMSNKDKKAYIKKNGVPFLSLVYIKGHIALYLGNIRGEPVIFHSVWGVKTKIDDKEGRHIVGKSVISSLELGKEIKGFDKDKSILSKIKGIVILSL